MRGWQVAFRELFPEEFLDGLDPRDRDSAFAARVKNEPSYHAAVAVDDDVVGFVGLGPAEDEDTAPDSVREIWGLYVEPDRMGTGLGRILMNHAFDYLEAGNWDYATLWTLRDVRRTCRFYEAGGWYRDGEDKVWEIPEGNPVTLVRYRFHLHQRSVPPVEAV